LRHQLSRRYDRRDRRRAGLEDPQSGRLAHRRGQAAMKFRRLVASLALTVFVGFAGSCSDTTDTITDQLNLDRPIDIAFACYGGVRLTGGGAATAANAADIVQSAMPLQACEIRSGTHSAMDLPPVPPGQETINDAAGHSQTTGSSFYYGFILQNETGTVALAHWDTKPSSAFAGGDVIVDDADPLIPGKNGIAVGEDPVAIAASTDGCYELTANAGSCDLSSIDVTSAVIVSSESDAADKGIHVIVNRLAVTNAAGAPIRA